MGRPRGTGKVYWRCKVDDKWKEFDRPPKVSESGGWYLKYPANVPGGWIKQAAKVPTKQHALDMLARIMGDVTKARIMGKPLEQIQSKQLEEIWDAYLSNCATVDRNRENTLKRKLEMWRDHVGPAFGKLNLRDIEVRHIDDYRASRLKPADPDKQPAMPATINREVSMLSDILTFASKRNWVERNVCRLVDRLPEENAKDRYFTPAEYRLLLECSGERFRPILTFACFTGMRLDEIARLRWEDVDAHPGFVRIGYQQKGRKLRYVTILQPVREVLDQLKGGVARIGYVFASPRTGKPYRGNTLYTNMRRACDLADATGKRQADVKSFTDVCFHTTRHTYTSWAIQAGVPEILVQQQLGHSSAGMTKRYAHLRQPIDPQAAADAHWLRSIFGKLANPSNSWHTENPDQPMNAQGTAVQGG